MDRAVAYLRVSTQQQQRSGLGIEAQRAAIARFAEAEPLTIIEEDAEFEPGRALTRWIDVRSSRLPWHRQRKQSVASSCRRWIGFPALLRLWRA